MDCAYNVLSLVIQFAIAVGTIGAFYMAFRQIRENKEQFDKDREERKELQIKSQANKVAVWFDDGRLPPHDMGDMTSYVPRDAVVFNDNTLPIYNVIVSVVSLYGAGPSENGEDNDRDYPCRVLFHEVIPGMWGAMIRTHGSGMGLIMGLEIAFTDSMGQNWIRRGNGILQKIDTNPLDYYEIPLPPAWSTPLRVEE